LSEPVDSAIIERFCPEWRFAEIHRNSLGQQMSYNRPGWSWFHDIFFDSSPHKIFMKSVQCGISDYAQLWMFNKLYHALSGAYIMPTNVKRDEYVNDRFAKLMGWVPIYKRALRDTDNTRVKHFWDASLHFLGSNVPDDFTGISIQWYVIDEFDKCNQGNLLMLEDRVSSARRLTGKEPEWLKISNPSIDNDLIHREYLNSDQKEWHVKCGSCGYQQPLDWFINFVKQVGDNEYENICQEVNGDYSPICNKCSNPLDRLGRGNWLPRCPENGISGYHISKLFTDQATVKELMDRFLAARYHPLLMQHFRNSELGMPYTGAGDKLEYADLERCARDYTMPHTAVGAVGGIDPGKEFHMKFAALENGQEKMIYAGHAGSVEETVRLLRQHNVTTYVVDGGAELHAARKILELHPGGYLSFYDRPNKPSVQPDIKTRAIHANRTESIDEMVEAHLTGVIVLPKNWANIDAGEFFRQMNAPTRQPRERSINGVKQIVYVWEEGSKADHYFHASNYCHMAAKKRGFGQQAIQIQWV
jgi:hypothetical protein